MIRIEIHTGKNCLSKHFFKSELLTDHVNRGVFRDVIVYQDNK